MYREPIFSLCLCNAFSASLSSAKRTKASPVARPSGFLTNNTPSSPSTREQEFSSPPLAKKSIWKEKIEKWALDDGEGTGKQVNWKIACCCWKLINRRQINTQLETRFSFAFCCYLDTPHWGKNHLTKNLKCLKNVNFVKN